jgi:hypothetical protein
MVALAGNSLIDATLYRLYNKQHETKQNLPTMPRGGKKDNQR